MTARRWLEAGGSEARELHPTAVLAVAIAAAFLAIVSASSLNVALPAIGTGLIVPIDDLHWVVTAYMTSFTVGIPIAGWLADTREPRSILGISLALFLLGSLAGAFAPSYALLIASRVVQGLGASAIMPVSMSLVSIAFPPERMGRALGAWAVGAVVGPAVGPTLGGILVEHVGWRAVLGINVPLAGLVLLLVGRLVPRLTNREAPAQGFDTVGFVLFAAGGAAVITSLSGIRASGAEPGSWGPAALVAVGAACWLAFLIRQRRAEPPLFPRRLTGDRAVRAAILLSIVRSLSLFGPAFLLPVMLQEVLGYGAQTTGLLLAANAVALGVFSPVSGRLIDRMGPRWPALAGVVLIAGSLWAYHDLGPGDGWWPITWPQVLRGAGIALIMNASSVTVLNRAAAGSAGRGASILTVTNQLSGAVGIAGLSALVASGLSSQQHLDGSIVGSASAASVFDQAFIVSAAICLLGLLPAAFLPNDAVFQPELDECA